MARHMLSLMFLGLLALSAGCQRRAPEETAQVSGESALRAATPASAMDAAGASMKSGAGELGGAGAPLLGRMATVQRYLIRDALITIETRDARKAADAMGAAAKQLGGYVGETTEDMDPLGVRSVTVQLRVPAERFDDLMRSIEKQGTVLTRHIGTQDVTEEFLDVEARLRNLKRTEERLLSHLARTGKLADTLAVERELARVRLEIEQYEGRMRYLRHNVAFSTATVTCREKARPGPAVPPESYSSGEVASAAVRSLVAFARSVWSCIIWFGIWTPVWLPVVVIVALIRRRRARRSRPA